MDSSPHGEVEATRQRRLQEVVELLTRRCSHLEKRQERQRAVVDELRSGISRLEEQVVKTQGDLTYAQRQLEFVVISLEKAHGMIADHTEQLRLYAGESKRTRSDPLHGEQQRSLVLILATWLYRPVLFFAKGIYSLLSPLILTIRSLSLLNSDVLQRMPDDRQRVRWGDAKQGDLLQMLQTGALDPAATGAKRPSRSAPRAT